MIAASRRPSRCVVRAVFASAALAAVGLAPRVASAYEHQYHLGASFGYVGIVGGNNGASGLGGRVHFDYGITDAVNLMTRVEMIDFPKVGVVLPSAAAGIGYVIDVLQWVPYFGAMAGVADIWTASCPMGGKVACGHLPKLDLEIPAGLDYLVTRRFALGAMGRYQLLLLNGNAVNSFGGFLKAEYIWGF
jgi:hypothetical protein